MAPWEPLRSKIKGQMDQICPGYALETTGLIFMIRKPYEIPFVLDALQLGHFPLGATEGLKRTHGAQFLHGIRYMSAHTELIFALIIYRGHIVTFNTRPLFTPAPDITHW